MYNQKSFNKTYIFFSIFLAIFSMENIYSEGYYLPENSRFIKTGYSIKNLCWNPNNTTFAYTEGNLVLIRNAETFELINSIEIPNIEKIMFSKEGSLNNEVLLTLTKDGKLATYNLSVSNQPSISLNYNDINTPPNSQKEEIKAISFSQNSNYIALADSKNIITLFFKLRLTNETIAYKSLDQGNTIYNIEFSPNTWYFATASKDDTIKLYSTNVTINLKPITTIPFYSKSNANVVFSQDSKNLICASKENEFSVYNLKGEKQFSVKTQNPIIKFKTLQNSTLLAVQTNKNQIEFYDLSTQEFIGFIPAYNSTFLTTFAFNSDNTSILIGHQDGSIYRFEIDTVFLEPNEIPPDWQVVPGSIADGYGNENLVTGFDDSFGNLDPNSLQVFKQNKNSIIPKIGLGFLQEPFLINLKISGEYRNVLLLNPVYFGGGIDLTCGFPRKDFPYTYTTNNSINAKPIIMGGNLFASVGVTFSPWLENLFLILGGKVGLSFYSLGFFPQGGYLITSPHIGFSTSVNIGASYKGFEFTLGVNYDTTNKFYPEILLGYQINLKTKEKTEKENIDAQEKL